MTIGKHGLTLYRSPHHERALVGYEWRRPRTHSPHLPAFIGSTAPPGCVTRTAYNHNDGQYAGMPLRKLWERCPLGAHARDRSGEFLPAP